MRFSTSSAALRAFNAFVKEFYAGCEGAVYLEVVRDGSAFMAAVHSTSSRIFLTYV